MEAKMAVHWAGMAICCNQFTGKSMDLVFCALPSAAGASKTLFLSVGDLGPGRELWGTLIALIEGGSC